MRSRCKLLTAAGVAALMALSMVDARAAATLTITDGTTTYSATDNGDGAIAYVNEAFGQKWGLTVTAGVTKPTLGTATNPRMNMIFQASSSGAGTLTVTFKEDGFGPVPDGTGISAFLNTTLNGGTITHESWVNTAPPSTPTTSGSAVGPVDDTQYGVSSGLDFNPWTMYYRITLTSSRPAFFSGDATLAVPEPSTYFAGAMLLLPFAASTVRFMRRNRTA